MLKLDWTSVGSIPVGPFQVPCAPGIKPELGSHAGWDQVAGIRTDTPRKRLMKAVTWPVAALSNELVGNAVGESLLSGGSGEGRLVIVKLQLRLTP